MCPRALHRLSPLNEHVVIDRRRSLLAPPRRFFAAWGQFWLAPMRASTYVLMRSALALTVIVWLVMVLPDLFAFYSESGVRPNPVYSDYRYGLFQWFQSDTAIVVVLVMTLVAACAVLSGNLVRLFGPLMWLGMMSFQLDNLSVLNAGDELLRVWCAYFAIFAVVTPNSASSISVRDLYRPNRDEALAPVWLLRMAQIQITLIYPASVIAKLDGGTWQDGTAALYALQVRDFQRLWVPESLTDNLAVGRVLTYLTLAIEIAVPVLLWIPRTRRFAIVVGMGMHLGFDYAMRLGFFVWSMAIGYCAFLTPREADWILRKLPWIEPALELEQPDPVAPMATM